VPGGRPSAEPGGGCAAVPRSGAASAEFAGCPPVAIKRAIEGQMVWIDPRRAPLPRRQMLRGGLPALRSKFTMITGVIRT
jgi:hypothetical protein